MLTMSWVYVGGVLAVAAVMYLCTRTTKDNDGWNEISQYDTDSDSEYEISIHVSEQSLSKRHSRSMSPVEEEKDYDFDIV